MRITFISYGALVNARKTLLTYGALFKIRALEELQYRVAALSGASISIFWALIELTVLRVFYTYASNRTNVSLTIVQVVAYVWLAQILHVLAPNNIDGELLTKITNGDIGVELCRPLDLYFHWFAKSAAGRVGASWWRSLITLAFACFVPSASIKLPPPASAAGFAVFLASLVTLLLLSTSYVMLVTSVRIGVSWGDGPMYVLMLISGVLSGAFLPLPLWPEFMQGFLRVQPFAGLLDFPARLYTGAILPGDAAGVIALQIGWSMLFVAAGRLIIRSKISRIIVQGG